MHKGRLFTFFSFSNSKPRVSRYTIDTTLQTHPTNTQHNPINTQKKSKQIPLTNHTPSGAYLHFLTPPISHLYPKRYNPICHFWLSFLTLNYHHTDTFITQNPFYKNPNNSSPYFSQNLKLKNHPK